MDVGAHGQPSHSRFPQQPPGVTNSSLNMKRATLLAVCHGTAACLLGRETPNSQGCCERGTSYTGDFLLRWQVPCNSPDEAVATPPAAGGLHRKAGWWSHVSPSRTHCLQDARQQDAGSGDAPHEVGATCTLTANSIPRERFAAGPQKAEDTAGKLCTTGEPLALLLQLH
jgi:hypothetical protein